MLSKSAGPDAERTSGLVLECLNYHIAVLPWLSTARMPRCGRLQFQDDWRGAAQ